MAYKETHEIELPPVTLPAGVELRTAQVESGQTIVFVKVTTSDSKVGAVQTLKQAFAALQAAAAGDLS
jgi:hypothetical protein